MVKKIHFILPSGGVRGCFQAGFMYELFTHYSSSFSIARVDGTSVGAINGIAVICDRIDLLKSIWFEISTIHDFFSSWSTLPIIGTLKNLYNGFYRNGLYNSNELRKKLCDNLLESIQSLPAETLDKYSCCATNVSEAKSEYVKGSHPQLIEYILASASPWILCNPKTINGQMYTDGAVLDAYPIQYVDDADADLTVIVGFDQESVHLGTPNTSHLLYFIASLLDISRLHSFNTFKLKQYLRTSKCIPITNTMKISMVNFSQENIREGFEQGQRMAHLFYRTYLNEKEDLPIGPSTEPTEKAGEEHARSASSSSM